MAIINGTIENFDKEIESGKVLVDFYADWCGPCKMISPILEELEATMNDLKVIKVDVDTQQEIASKYGVMAMPTMIIFKDGNKMDQKVGALAKEDLQTWIEQI